MKAYSGKEIIKTFEKNGWKLLRIHGSHHIMGKAETEIRLSIPVHGKKPLKSGLVKHLIRLANIDI